MAEISPVQLWTALPDGNLDPKSGVAGGHCFFFYAADQTHATMRNSWGTTWGAHGDALVAWSDVQALVDAGAEASIPIGYVP